jgi:hypothetical protein
MEEVSRLNTDALSGKSADLLHQLSAIEAKLADTYRCSAGNMSVSVQIPRLR